MTEENLTQSSSGQPVKPTAPEARPKKDPRDKLYHPKKPFILASSPHFHAQASVPKIMWSVVVALIPTSVLALIYFQWAAASLVLTCVSSALLAEMVVNRVKGESFTIPDGSALITGLLLALTLPPAFSLGGAALGSVFAIVVAKHFFGGLGYNIFNPALLGRAFLQASFPVPMTTWSWPLTARYADVDGITAATPLGLHKFEHVTSDLSGLLTGNISGSLGETSAIAILIGGLFLLIRKYADWRIPLSFLLSVFLVSGAFWLISPESYPTPVFQLFSGGLMLGAFFMATDMVTSPVTAKGAWIFGGGAGFLLVIIRLFGGLPEGVMYSILLMNAFTPLINRYTRPKFFGQVLA